MWDIEVLRHLFLLLDVHIISSLLVGYGIGDVLIWHFNAKGDYCVRVRYKLAMEHC